MTISSIQSGSASVRTSVPRIRIHATTQLIVARTFALQIAAFGLGDLAFGVYLLAHGDWKGLLPFGLVPLFVLGTVSAHRAAIRGAPRIFATRDGLEFVTDTSSFYAWGQIREITLLPYLYLTTSSMARTYQVELVDGSTFRFVGRFSALKSIARARR